METTPKFDRLLLDWQNYPRSPKWFEEPKPAPIPFAQLPRPDFALVLYEPDVEEVEEVERIFPETISEEEIHRRSLGKPRYQIRESHEDADIWLEAHFATNLKGERSIPQFTSQKDYEHWHRPLEEPAYPFEAEFCFCNDFEYPAKIDQQARSNLLEHDWDSFDIYGLRHQREVARLIARANLHWSYRAGLYRDKAIEQRERACAKLEQEYRALYGDALYEFLAGINLQEFFEADEPNPYDEGFARYAIDERFCANAKDIILKHKRKRRTRINRETEEVFLLEATPAQAFAQLQSDHLCSARIFSFLPSYRSRICVSAEEEMAWFGLCEAQHHLTHIYENDPKHLALRKQYLRVIAQHQRTLERFANHQPAEQMPRALPFSQQALLITQPLVIDLDALKTID